MFCGSQSLEFNPGRVPRFGTIEATNIITVIAQLLSQPFAETCADIVVEKVEATILGCCANTCGWNEVTCTYWRFAECCSVGRDDTLVWTRKGQESDAGFAAGALDGEEVSPWRVDQKITGSSSWKHMRMVRQRTSACLTSVGWGALTAMARDRLKKFCKNHRRQDKRSVTNKDKAGDHGVISWELKSESGVTSWECLAFEGCDLGRFGGRKVKQVHAVTSVFSHVNIYKKGFSPK